jgi:hypothetical protein
MTDPVFDTSGASWEHPPIPIVSMTLVRPADLLTLRVSFHGMRRDGARMVPATAGQPGLMVIDLPTQHTAEEVQPAGAARVPLLWRFPRPAASSAPDETLWQARLAFQVATEVALTWEGLLDWSAHRPVLPDRLQPRAPGQPVPLQGPGPAGPLATAINLPAGLWTAPVGDGVWRHARAPVGLPDAAGNHATEVWHSARRGPDGSARVPYRVHGWQPNRGGQPEIALTQQARSDLTHASLLSGAPWLADHYVLGTLGASFRTRITLDQPALTTKAVGYEVTQGRDRSAVISSRGWLLPIACPVLVSASFERHFVAGAQPTAPWIENPLLIHVLNPVGRAASGFCRSMTMHDTLIHAQAGTPPLVVKNPDGSDRYFPLTYIDAHGLPHRSQIQLTLVLGVELAEAFRGWHGQKDLLDLAGQQVHFADHDQASLPTTTMNLRFTPRGSDGVDVVLEQAVIAHPALDAFAPAALHTVAPPAGAAPGAIDAVSGRFLSLVSARPALDFSKRADAVGGIASPSLTAAALSVTHGVLSKDAAALPTPAEVFGSLSAKLLGTLDLVKLFQASGFDPPKLIPVNTPTERGVRFDWDHDITPSSDAPLDVLAARDAAPIKLALHASVMQPQPGAGSPEPRTEITGTLTHFMLKFPPPSAGGTFVEVAFDDATFHKAPNEQRQVTANVAGVQFVGALAFLQVLQQFLPPDGFSNPPDLKVDASSAQLDYTLGLPAIGMGLFSLTNVRLAAGLGIPFTDAGAASFNFSFSRFENPFQVSVMGFAGHGYFQVAADTRGLQMLDAAIEFGGALDFSFGPVQGGISAAGGLRFTYTRDTHDVAVMAYFHFCGGVSLFCIGVSVDATMGLQYDSNGNCFSGEVRVELTVHLCFFSKSFGFTVHKTFAGSAPPARSVGAMAATPALTSPAAHLTPMAGFADAFDLNRWLAWNAAFGPPPALPAGG